MILPNVRASIESHEIEQLLGLLGGQTRRGRQRWEGRLVEEGLDSLLDDPLTLAAVMEGAGVSTVSPKLAFYIMVRHTLLESGLEDASIADYIAALLVEFAETGRSRNGSRVTMTRRTGT